MRRKEPENIDRLVESCLAAYVAAGALNLSLDQLATRVGTSKRMLIHYFGSREGIEEKAVALLEDRLRSRFASDQFWAGASLESVVIALWDSSTAPEAKGVLLLIMDVARRGWGGSERALAFAREQQRLWIEMLRPFLPDVAAVEELLQLFQGAILGFLATGDREPGRRALRKWTRRNQIVD